MYKKSIFALLLVFVVCSVTATEHKEVEFGGNMQWYQWFNQPLLNAILEASGTNVNPSSENPWVQTLLIL